MSCDSTQEYKTEMIYEAQIEESSEEPHRDDWSSVIITIPEKNTKRLLHEQGLYEPGSGEICLKFIAMSDSSVLRHPYFNYPPILDPGIEEALLNPEKKIIYPIDGQELYIALCKEMNQCPVKIFYKGLITDTIDLKYYCVDPFGVKAMAAALCQNRHVTRFDLTENFLNDDSCFHLGEMLLTNTTLKELNLSGCRIGSTGAKQLFAYLPFNRGLKVLNLNKNQLDDMGVTYLAEVVERGIDVQEINLSHNEITGKSCAVLAEAFEINNKFTHLDLSWNNLYAPVSGTVVLLNCLFKNKFLLEVNLSWNSLCGGRLGTAISAVLRCPNLATLDLSHNQLSGEAIENIIANLNKAKKLVTLNLSFNPMTPDDAVLVLMKMKLKSVKVKNILMNNIYVNGAFLRLLKQIMQLKMRSDMSVTYGGVIGCYQLEEPDMRELVLNRAEFLTKNEKTFKVDIALFALQLLKDNFKIMSAKSFDESIEATGAPLSSSLIDEIVNAFPGPKTKKNKTIDISLLVEFIKRKWPERKLTLTPPPEPEIEPEPLNA